MPNEEDLSQADQGVWKDLSQDVCYWTEGEQRFVWAQGQPSHSLHTLFQEILTRAHALDFDRVHDRAIDFDWDRDYNRAIDINVDLVPTFVSNIDHSLGRDRDRAIGYAHAFIFALDRAVNRPHTHAHALDLVQNHTRFQGLIHILNLYTSLVLLKERREQRLPAWEGILLLKEQLLDA